MTPIVNLAFEHPETARKAVAIFFAVLIAALVWVWMKRYDSTP